VEFGTAKRLQYLLDNDPELRRLAEVPEPAAPVSEGLAALGVPYQLGSGWLRPVGRRAFVALRAIDSPLLGRIEDAQPIDAYRALYVVCHDARALRQVMACDQRLRILESQKALAAGSPEMLTAYLKRVDDVARETWAAFDEEALTFAAIEFGDPPPVDVLNVLACALRDAVGQLAQAGSAQKKTGQPPSTSTGSGMSTLCARAWAWTRTPFRWLASVRWWRRSGEPAAMAAGAQTPTPPSGSAASEK